MQFDTSQAAEAWDGLVKSHQAERLGHAYILAGAPRGIGRLFAEQMLQLFLCRAEKPPCGTCTDCTRVVSGRHPDVHWVEPRSKSRQILGEDMDQLTTAIHQTSFEGGGKAGVILSADRLNVTSANKFLKTLEEPPRGTLLLLVTDLSEALLPTIHSRCQFIQLGGGDEIRNASWYNDLVDLFAGGWPTDGLAAWSFSARLSGLLQHEASLVEARLEEEEGDDCDPKVLEARVAARRNEVRNQVLEAVSRWQRDLLVLLETGSAAHFFYPELESQLRQESGQVNRSAVMTRIQRIERVSELLHRNIPEDLVFERGFSPTPAAPAGGGASR